MQNEAAAWSKQEAAAAKERETLDQLEMLRMTREKKAQEEVR